MKKILDKVSGFVLPIFAVVWTIAMISLWEWNVNGTGVWFAFLMVFAGVVVLVASLAHTFKWWDKLKARCK